MKKLIALIGLGLGLALPASAQNTPPLPHGAVLALTQPNPAKSIEVDFGATPVLFVGNLVFVDFTISGIGQWNLDLYTTDGTWVSECDWTRNAGQPTEYTFIFDAATFDSFTIHLCNVHGYSVVFPPSEYRHN